MIHPDDLCEFQRHDVGAVFASNAMEMGAELLPCFSHFCGVTVPLVDALYLVLFSVIEATFCYFRQDAHHRHERRSGAPKIMRSPFASW